MFWTKTGPLGDRDLYAQRFGSAGTPLWPPGGISVCAQPGDQGAFFQGAFSGLTAVSDGAGGACATWLDTRSDPAGNVYAQRVDASGAPQWPAAGVPLCTAPGAESNALVAVPDGSGGLIAAWEDGRTSDGSTGVNLYAQRVGGDGVARWTPDGVPLCTAPGDQRLYAFDAAASCLAGDGAGGVFVAWTGQDGVVSAQHLDAGGTPIWPLQGLAFSSSGAVGEASVISDGAGGCIVLWGAAPAGPGSSVHLYARPSSGAVTGIGTPGPRVFLVRDVRPNPARGPFRLEFSLAERGAVRLEVFDVAGRRVARREEAELGPGDHTLTVGALAPGLYSVRLRQGTRGATTRAIVVR